MSTTSPSANAPETTHELPLRLPGKVQGWPTQHIKGDDLTWLYGLYAHRWGIHYAPITDTDSEDATTIELGKIFQFKGFKTAMSFVNGVADLAHDEKHHPWISIDTSIVVIHTSTHSAKVNAEDIETTPGITLRDLRLALLIEDFYQKEFLSKNAAIELNTEDSGYYTPYSMEDLYSGQRM